MIAVIGFILWLWKTMRTIPATIRQPFRRRSAFARIAARRKRLGRSGERLARHVLEERGMEFLARNYRHGHCEIDIVMRDDDELCFVEVKTRSRQDGYRPADAVGRDKQRNVIRAAKGYLRAIGQPRIPFRFDIMEVQYRHGRLFSVNHIRNAFEC